MRLAEGHVMSDTSTVPLKPGGDRPPRRPLVDEQLADELLGKAQAEGVTAALAGKPWLPPLPAAGPAAA
jgi:hypothetical protein